MKQVIGLGAGGHSEIIIELLQSRKDLHIVGLLDPNPLSGGLLLGVPVLGGDDHLQRLFRRGVAHAFNGVGGFGQRSFHRKVFERAASFGFRWVDVVHPSAVISPSAQIGEGTVIFAQAVVNTGAQIGRNVIVNTAVTVDHHCRIGDHVHLAPGVRLAGGVSVGSNAQIGIGTVVKECITIGRDVVIGAGSVVLKDIPDGTLAFGAPARYKPLLRP